MSLWEVDMINADRSAPTIDTHDINGNRMAHSTTGFTLVTDSTENAPKLVIKDGKVKLYKSDGTFLANIGVRSADGDAAFDLAKPGQTL